MIKNQPYKKLNLIGEKFGKLTVIDYDGIINKRSSWKCLCECGTKKSVIGTNLKRGNTKSCGCNFSESIKYNFKDLTNQKFGKLTVLRKTDEYTKTRGVIWECSCECGAIIKLPTNSLTSKNNTSCGNKKIHAPNGRFYKDLVVGEIPISHINAIKQNAIKRNILFEIDNEYLWELFLKQNRKCVLSGEELIFTKKYQNGRNETTASLDRIDSNKGYIKGNIQWVHKYVNKMKSNKSDDEFLNWCRKCYLHSLNN